MTQLVTPAEIAAALKVSVRSAMRWAAGQGLTRYSITPQRPRYSAREVDQALRKQTICRPGGRQSGASGVVSTGRTAGARSLISSQ